MADRVLKKSITRDERVAQLPQSSQLLYAYAIPFLDNEGRMPGEPDAVRTLAAPLLPWSDLDVDQFIAAWTRTTRTRGGHTEVDPLVIRYTVDPPRRWREKDLQLEFECRLGLQFAGIHNQPLRLRRGARSTLPPPDLTAGQLVLMDTLAQHDQPNHLAQMVTRSREPSKESARPRSQAGFKTLTSGLEVQELAAAAASRAGAQEPDDGIGWMRGEFQSLFGRSSPEPVGPRREQLVVAVASVGRDGVVKLMRERLQIGAVPKSIGYFLPAMQELTPTRVGAPTPTRRRVEACVECAVGGGLHAAGCPLAPVPDEHADAVRLSLAEIGVGLAVREVPAA